MDFFEIYVFIIIISMIMTTLYIINYDVIHNDISVQIMSGIFWGFIIGILSPILCILFLIKLMKQSCVANTL